MAIFRSVSISLLLAFVFLNLIAASSVIDHSELTPEAFKAEVDQLDVALIKFYAPWCGHCKRLAPAFEEAAKILAEDENPVPLIKVDCTNEKGGKDICNQNEVQGYPTVKIYKSGKSEDYNDGRDADSIVRKMRSLSGPAFKEVDSFEKLDKLYKDAKNLLVIGLFKNSEEPLYQTFVETAKSNRDLASYVLILEDKASDKLDKLKSLKSQDVKVPSIILARQTVYRSIFEPHYLVYDSVDELKVWIKENQHGLVVARSPSNQDEVPKPFIVVYYNVDYEKDPKGTNYWRNRVLKVVAKFKDEDVTFAISPMSSFAAELSEYGHSVNNLSKDSPPVAVAKNKDGQKFHMKDKFTMDVFEVFIRDFLNGKLEPFLKSAEEPDNTDAGVKVAVGKNFNDLVTKSEKDILIEFYAPWCGHCKALAPAWDELGEKLKGEPGVDIVKIDATANDFPSEDFVVHGFPTIYWYPKDSKSPVKYEGSRDVDALLKYVAEKATDELVAFDRNGEPKTVKDEL